MTNNTPTPTTFSDWSAPPPACARSKNLRAKTSHHQPTPHNTAPRKRSLTTMPISKKARVRKISVIPLHCVCDTQLTLRRSSASTRPPRRPEPAPRSRPTVFLSRRPSLHPSYVESLARKAPYSQPSNESVQRRCVCKFLEANLYCFAAM